MYDMDGDTMKRLVNDPHMRTTDHAGEIAWLRLEGITTGERLRSLAFMTAAELLQGHDETGISLDNWDAPRALVEHLLGHAILENGV